MGILIRTYIFFIFACPFAFSNGKTISIASFNIQFFGKSKAGEPDVMAVISDIVSRFDIVAIQEIREKTDNAIFTLMTLLGDDYDYVIGERQGRTRSTERYMFVFNKNTVNLTYEISYSYIDTFDRFEREPFIARFRTVDGNFSFVLIDVHIKPEDALNEINALEDVIDDARNYYSNEDDFIVLGDMNADCSYLNEDKNNNLKNSEYIWLIGDEFDTTVASNDCTYDRIITTQGAREDFTGEAGVYKFDDIYDISAGFAKKVSDHYPVFAKFYVNKDSVR